MNFPDDTSEITHILVVSNTLKSKDFYINVLGAKLYSEYSNSVVLKFLENWILLVKPGGPTADKPNTHFKVPKDINNVSSSFTIRVNNCHKIYNILKKRGVIFITRL